MEIISTPSCPKYEYGIATAILLIYNTASIIRFAEPAYATPSGILTNDSARATIANSIAKLINGITNKFAKGDTIENTSK